MHIRLYNNTFEFEVIVTDKKKNFPWKIPKRAQAICNIHPDSAHIYIKTLTHRVIVHECIHIAQWILNYKWIKTGYENTEVLAYVTDWIYNEILKLFENKKK